MNVETRQVDVNIRLTALAIGVLAGLGALGSTASARTLDPKAPPASVPIFGYVKSITHVGSGYLVRFDPAFILTGNTATQAAKDDGMTADGDFYIRNPDTKLLSFKLAGSAHASVVTAGNGPVNSTSVSVAELAQIVAGKNPNHRSLMSGTPAFWIVTNGDTVTAVDQQYLP